MPTATKNSPLSGQEVCSIIEVSAKAGVMKISFQGLQVEFGRPVEIGGTRYLLAPDQQPAYPLNPSVNTLTPEQHTKQTKAAVEQEEILTREEEMAQALIDDPVKYEEMLNAGELGKDGSIHTDDSDDEDES